MVISGEFKEYILERLECFGPVVARKMFGGLRLDFEKAGMGQFKPFGEKSYSMSYYEVPPEVLDDNQALKEWASRAYEAAIRVNTAHLKKKRKKKK